MRIAKNFCLASLVLAGCVWGSPFPESMPALKVAEHEERGLAELKCLLIDLIVRNLKNSGAKATSFCSSYLSIPLATSTAFSAITVTPSPVTVKITSIPGTETSTVVVTSTITSGTSYSLLATPGARLKRHNNIPSFIPNVGAPKLSAACSCLSIRKATTTVTTVTSTTLPALTITTTITEATPYTLATSTITQLVAQTTIPEFCNPANNIRGAGIDFNIVGNYSPAQSRPVLPSKLACCLACFNTANCFGYRWILPPNPSRPEGCTLYMQNVAGTPPTGPLASKCPLGLISGNYVAIPDGDPGSQNEYGICASNAIY